MHGMENVKFVTFTFPCAIYDVVHTVTGKAVPWLVQLVAGVTLHRLVCGVYGGQCGTGTGVFPHQYIIPAMLCTHSFIYH